MTIPIHEARIDVYRGPSEDSTHGQDPDFVIPGSDIDSIEVNARTGEVMDDVSITLHNHEDQYTGEKRLTQADRLDFAAPMETGDKYGDAYYGSGMWGGTYTIMWSGRITDMSASRDGPQTAMLDVDARDYPADVLATRKITDSYVDRDVIEIIRDICEQKAPELDTSNLRPVGVTTDAKYSSRDCWDAVLKLAARADAIVIPRGNEIRIEEVTGLPYMFELADEDFYLPLDTETDDSIRNSVRIDSGENRKLEASQEDIYRWGYQRATKDDPVTHRLRARKSEVHSVELYIRKRGDDDDDERSLSVRLQSDENGEPVAIGDENSDIVSTTWQADDLPDEGWKTFFFDEHVLADRDPWLIIHGEEGGHDIAHNEDGELAYRSFYPHPLNYEVDSQDSINEYGLREVRIERSNLKTLGAVRDAARAELARTAWPSKTVDFEARSKRAHSLQPGDRIDINRPTDNISGEHIITEVSRTWDSSSTMLHSVMTAEWRKGLLAPVED